MGFGSGGGGFTPSPNNVPGSTTTGTDKDTDVHEFTGSVDITGSLLINGVQITQNGGGGGGGSPGGSNSQVQYNDGGSFGGASALVYDDVNNRVGVGTTSPESTLEVRSTTTQQKWSYDDDNEATLTVGSDGETVLAVSGTVGSSPSSDLVFDVSKGGDVFIRRQGDRLRFGVSTGTTTIQTDNAGTDIAFVCHPAGGLGNINTEIARFDNSGAGALLMSGTISSPGGDAPINFRDTATSIHSPGSNRLAITAPTLEVTGTLAVTDTNSSGSLATDLAKIGADPVRPDTFMLSHVDHFTNSNYAIQQRSNGDTIVNAPASRTVGLRIGGNNALTVAGGSNNNVSIGNLGTPTARLHITGALAEQDLLRVDAADTSAVFFVSGSGRVGVNTAVPVQTLSVSGSAAFSGTYGSTAVETRSTNLDTLTATDGVAIIDLTSAATDTSFVFFISNGTYIGQEKIVYVKTIVGADGANSNDAELQGTNIDSPTGNATGRLSLSASDPGDGFFGFSRGGARLLWDGADWAPISVTNLSWS